MIWVSFVMAASEMSVLSLCLAIIYGRKICPLVWFPSLWKNSAPNLARSSSTIYIWPMPIDMRHVFPRCWMDDPCLPAKVRYYSQILLTWENLSRSSSTSSGLNAKVTYDLWLLTWDMYFHVAEWMTLACRPRWEIILIDYWPEKICPGVALLDQV